MPQLDPTWFASQLFWLAVCFILLHFILSRLVLPPLTGIVQRREDTIAADLSAAEELRQSAERARQDYERHLATTREGAQKLMDEAALLRKQEAEQAERRLNTELSAKIADAEKRIADKKRELMNGLSPATAELTALIVQKLTRQEPSADKVAMAIQTVQKGN